MEFGILFLLYTKQIDNKGRQVVEKITKREMRSVT